MSFNARLPPSASSGYRGRGRGNRGRGPPGVPIKTEDAQPNELLSKRNVSGPPIIRASAPQPARGRGRGGAASSNSRNQAPPIPRRAPWRRGTPIGRGRPQYDALPSVAVAGPSREAVAHSVGMEDPRISAHRHDAPHLAPSLTAASWIEHGLPGWTPLVVENEPRGAERPTRAAQSTSVARSFLPDKPVWSQGNLNRMLPAHTSIPQSSSGSHQYEGGEGTPIPPHSKPPLPRRQFIARTREVPPHLDPSTTSTPQTGVRDTQLDAPQVGARGTNTGLPPQTQRESAQERARTSLASASALLLSDLQRPPTTAPSAGASIRPDDEVPRPAKRRRLTPIAGSSQTLFEASASTNPTPLPAAVNDHDSLPSEHRDYAPSLADSGAKSRTASTHAAPPQAPAIKRECSASPALDADVPHLVTEGCVRIAPLPPECKAGRAGYQNARREWTTREAKKLRELGLKPTRVFIREDGMVIDWRSDIPVMSDTLRPPSAEDAIAQVQPSAPAQGIGLGAGSSIAPAGPRGSQGQSCPSNHQGAGQPPPAALEALVSNNTQASSSTMQRQPLPPVPRTLVSPAPGETIWTRVLPPRQAPPLPPPLPLSADVARTATPSASRGPATNIERYDRHRHRPQPATTTATTRQQISPDVEIIDLTEEAGYDDSRSQGRSALSFVDRPRISAALREQPAAGTPPTSNTDATPGSIMDTDEMQRGAVAFLERFLAGYNSDRSALASAYSRVATFSVQTVSSPRTRTHTAASSSLVDALTAAALGCAPSNPIDVDASDTPAESGSRSHPSPYPPTIHRQGRVDIIAALLDLPPLDVGNEVSDSNSDSDPDSGSAKLTVEWDLVHAPEAGDVLLICYAVATLAKRKAKRSRMEKDGHRDMEREKRTRDKGKGKATDRPASRADTASGARRGRMCIYEQRFLLRPREWDEEDRSTPGVWPLVAVAHQVLLRRLPP